MQFLRFFIVFALIGCSANQVDKRQNTSFSSAIQKPNSQNSTDEGGEPTFASQTNEASDTNASLTDENEPSYLKGQFVVTRNTTTAQSTQVDLAKHITDRVAEKTGKHVDVDIRTHANSAGFNLTSSSEVVEVINLSGEVVNSIDPLELANILSDSAITVEPDYVVKNYSDDTFGVPSKGAWGQDYYDLWGLEKISAEMAWSLANGAGVKVAVIDTGVDAGHPDLAGQVISGYNVMTKSVTDTDDNGHGTHVAGTIAAVANNGIGIAGVAPGAKILSYKVLNSFGSGSLSDVASAVRMAVDDGASVINMSLGGYVGLNNQPYFLEDALKYAVANNVTVVVAAGNSSSDVAKYSPGGSQYAVSVAASDSEDATTSFSNRGLNIAVSAPGGGSYSESHDHPLYNILSLLSTNASARANLSRYIVGADYARLGGTSMASPHVAAVAALVYQKNPGITASQVMAVLNKSVDDKGVVGFDEHHGNGRINALKAVQISSPIGVQILKTNSPRAGEDARFTISVEGESLDRWVLEANLSGGEWTQVAQGVAEMNMETILWQNAALNLKQIPLRLTAFDSSGNAFTDNGFYYSGGGSVRAESIQISNVNNTTKYKRTLTVQIEEPISITSATVMNQETTGFALTDSFNSGVGTSCKIGETDSSCFIEVEFYNPNLLPNEVINDSINLQFHTLADPSKTQVLNIDLKAIALDNVAYLTTSSSVFLLKMHKTQVTRLTFNVHNKGFQAAKNFRFDFSENPMLELVDNRCGPVVDIREFCTVVLAITNHAVEPGEKVYEQGSMVWETENIPGKIFSKQFTARVEGSSEAYLEFDVSEPVSVEQGRTALVNVAITNKGYDTASEFGFSAENNVLDVINKPACLNELVQDAVCNITVKIDAATLDVGRFSEEVLVFYRSVDINKRDRFAISFEVTEQAINPFHNYENPFDVNGDGRVSSLDALNVINHIGKYESGEVPGVEGFYHDANDDGRITSLDALVIINYINRQAAF